MKDDFTDFIEVSGLLKYDPETISKIYRRNPKRLFRRLWQTLLPIFAYLFSVCWDKWLLKQFLFGQYQCYGTDEWNR